MTTPEAMELTVGMGVLPWEWPTWIRAFRAGKKYCAFRNSAPISASAALDISALMSWAILSTDPLFFGSGESFDKKQCPPDWLCALGSLKQDVSLCTARIMSLVQYTRPASGWVAA